MHARLVIFSRAWIAGFLALLSVPLSIVAQNAPQPLLRAHAHNDYEHARPLLDALDCGFCSVEADVHLVQGELLVAHGRAEVNPGRTLQALYLDPLQERVKRNGGRVFLGGPEVSLLIDLKTDWTVTYPALRAVLTNYAGMLTSFEGSSTRTNAVRVIVSGSRSLRMFSGEQVRYATYDGMLTDLDSTASPNLIPWISASWSPTFQWRGAGEIPGAELEQLKQLVNRAHTQGRRVRFWGAPDKASFWEVLWNAGVDLINTDDLPGLQRFILSKQPGL